MLFSNELGYYLENIEQNNHDDIYKGIVKVFNKYIHILNNAYTHNLNIYSKLQNAGLVNNEPNYNKTKQLLSQFINDSYYLSPTGPNAHKTILVLLDGYVAIYRVNKEIYDKIMIVKNQYNL